MCGIAGFYAEKDTGNLLQEMANTIAHRGPDNTGTFTYNNFHLAHRRLGIIDLSATANQPMVSANGRFIIVFNGELYNYKELAQQYHLKTNTSSDTEVLLELFALKRENILQELNGMFAAAILDKEEEKLYLFRDRIGKKPLYYSIENKQLVFASELKAIAKFPMQLSLNKKAVSAFLHLGFIPSPGTIYTEIQQLPPGHLLVFSNSENAVSPWWSLSDIIEPSVLNNEKAALERLEHLLQSAVELRLQSDVPFGCFLSGGIDSSLVTSFASKICSHKVATFSLGFQEAQYDESVFAKKIAAHLGTAHHELIITQQEALDHLLPVIENFDQPYSDSSALPFFLISKLAREKATMALTGDGGDELFMGYGSAIWADRLANPLIAGLGSLLKPALLRWGTHRQQRAMGMFGKAENREATILSQEQYLFTTAEIFELTHEVPLSSAFQIQENFRRSLSAKEKQAVFDLKFYLSDDLMVKTDRASMLNSMEVRSPLLDHRLVAFAMNLSEDLKIKEGQSKYLLKKLLYKSLPETLFNRPKKGFSIPLKEWLKKELRFLLEENLSKERLEETGLLNIAAVEKLKKDFFGGKDFLYNRLWALCVLQLWLRKNKHGIQ